MGVSYAAEANNDTTDTHQILKESSTTTDSVDNSIKQENSINKEIKKQTNENKTTKTASKNLYTDTGVKYGEYVILQPYTFGERVTSLTETFSSNVNYYDPKTHYYLGKYLRLVFLYLYHT